jgi:hypothetical protein
MNKKEAHQLAKLYKPTSQNPEVVEEYPAAGDGITQLYTITLGKRGGLNKAEKLGMFMTRGSTTKVRLPIGTIVRRDHTINGWTKYEYFVHGVEV